MKGILILRLMFLLAIFAISLPRSYAQGGTPVFLRRYIPPAEERPTPEGIMQLKPIPQKWLFVGGTVAALIFAVVLVASARAWRASNLFGRKYLFPSGEEVAALRFGGNRSGGFMAVIETAEEKKDS